MIGAEPLIIAPSLISSLFGKNIPQRISPAAVSHAYLLRTI